MPPTALTYSHIDAHGHTAGGAGWLTAGAGTTTPP